MKKKIKLNWESKVIASTTWDKGKLEKKQTLLKVFLVFKLNAGFKFPLEISEQKRNETQIGTEIEKIPLFSKLLHLEIGYLNLVSKSIMQSKTRKTAKTMEYKKAKNKPTQQQLLLHNYS